MMVLIVVHLISQIAVIMVKDNITHRTLLHPN